MPSASVEAEPSKGAGIPTVALGGVKAATGDWSGVSAIPAGKSAGQRDRRAGDLAAFRR